MQNKKVIVMYRLFFVLTCLSGIILGLLDKSSDSFMGNGTALNFYTLQSNIWVLVLEAYLLFKAFFDVLWENKSHEDKKSNFEANLALESASPWNDAVLKYVFTVSIILTYLVYWFMIAPFLKVGYVFKPVNFLLHGTTPIMMFLDFVLLDRDKKVPKRALILAPIPALYYFIFALVRAEVSSITLTLGSRYPYWFMDVDIFRMVGK